MDQWRARCWSIATMRGSGWSTPSTTSGSRHYSASVQVIAEGEASCRLVWIIDMLPNELAAYVQGQTRDAVAAIHRAFPAVAA